MSEHTRLDLKRLEEIKFELDDLSKRYGIRSIINMHDELEKEIEIQDLYGMSGRKRYIHNFCISFVCSDYKLSNKVENKKVDKKWLMLLDSGNVGPLSICYYEDYSWCDVEIYKPMRKEIEALSCAYDSINAYWLFEPGEETIDKIKEIINRAYEEYREKRKEHEKEKLLKRLAELDGH